MINNKNILNVLEILNYKGKSAIFGGFLRDVLVGVEPKDVDIITNLTSDEVLNVFPKASIRKTIKGIDVISFSKGNMFFEVIPTDINLEKRASQSDLTVNTLFFNENGLIDTTTGLLDISNKRLHYTDKIMYENDVMDSPHTWLKPFRHSAKLGFECSPELIESLSITKDTFRNISQSIKVQEAYKILATKNPFNAIENLTKVGLFSTFDGNYDNSFEYQNLMKNHYHLILCSMALVSNYKTISEFITLFELPKLIEEKFNDLYSSYISDSKPNDFRVLNELLLLKRLLESKKINP